jgi:hypothetical protein
VALLVLPEVLVALAMLEVLVMMVMLLEMSLSRRGGGDANHRKAAEHHGEGHKSFHWSSPQL